MRFYLEGFFLGASLIVAIGAQNAFVLREGLAHGRIFLICLLCALCDGILISLGVAGVGSFFASHPSITAVATWAGVAFLTVYGLRSIRKAWKDSEQLEGSASPRPRTTSEVVRTTLGFTLLNPHVYLDTVVLFGTVAARIQTDDARTLFGLGGFSASCVWFFALGYGAKMLAPLFRNPKSWKVLDTAIGLFLLFLAFQLARSAF